MGRLSTGRDGRRSCLYGWIWVAFILQGEARKRSVSVLGLGGPGPNKEVASNTKLREAQEVKKWGAGNVLWCTSWRTWPWKGESGTKKSSFCVDLVGCHTKSVAEHWSDSLAMNHVTLISPYLICEDDMPLAKHGFL